MKIRFAFYFIFLIVSTQNVSAQLPNDKVFELKINKFSQEKVRGQTFWLIECHLQNYSKDTLSYLSMSCSRTYFFTLNNNGLEIEEFECDKNFPVILEIAPGETRSEVIRLFQKDEKKKIHNTTIKLGLKVIETKSTDNFEKMIKNGNITWSNSISL